jgi:hypothetical protein
LERWITALFLRAAKTYQIVVLTGARQVGKSTFLRNAPGVKNWEYVTLDDFDVLEAAKKAPGELLAGKKSLIIDEVQKAPNLLSSIKQAVDAPGNKTRFILSGSANLLLMHKVSESLAGRAVYYALRPLTQGEIEGRNPSLLLDSLFALQPPKSPPVPKHKNKLENLICRGFLPPVVVRFKSLSAILGWMEGYVATFLERDLRQLTQIENLPDFRRLMGILALRSGQMLNQSEISRDAAIPQPTVHRHLNLLEIAFLLEKVPAFASSKTKRLIKTPKIYWMDCGLASFLMGLHEPKDLKKSREWGALFETLVFQHLKAWASLKIPSPRIFYWRTATGQEIDFVIEWGNKLVAIEVKSSSMVKYSDAENLRVFIGEYPGVCAGIVVYTGNSLRQIGKKIWAVPWEMLV